MEESLSSAFQHRDIKDVRILVREASFFLGALKTEIRLRLYVTPDDEAKVHYEQSHHLQTPMSTETSSVGSQFAYSESGAFEDAVSELTDAYDMAVMAGHRPQEDWLVPNKYFQ